MHIAGLQKMTLLDFPGRVACTVFLPGCNFRCPFCHNSGLIGSNVPEGMSLDGFFSFLNSRKGLLDGVCVSGGEPTVSPDLTELLRQIKVLGFAVKLDTNGSHPEVLKALVQEGLVDYVAMDAKSSPQGYPAAVGLSAPPMKAIEESLRFLMNCGIDYELRTTVVKELHDDALMMDLGQWLYGLNGNKKIKKLFLQPFVDRDSVLNQNLHPPETVQLSHFIELLSTFAEKVSIRG